MATALFEKQLKKGRVGELAFQKMALKHFDEVFDYSSDYERWKNVQGKGIDFGVKMDSWEHEIKVDVKSNLYFSKYSNCYAFDIEYEKWHPSKKNMHNRVCEEGWIQDSKSNRIYHMEIIRENNRWVATGNYLYYDLEEMRSFVYKEWDKSETSWIRKNAYVGTKESDYAHLIPVRLTDERFKHLIRRIEIEEYK
jgi:hypothetical protein